MEAVIGAEVSTDTPDPYIMRHRGETATRKWEGLKTEGKIRNMNERREKNGMICAT